MSYRNQRFVYETPIFEHEHEHDALAKAAAQAVERATRFTGDYGLGHAFRVIDASYSYIVDADREEYGTRTQLEIVAFPVTKRTGAGFRIRLGGWDHAPETTWVAFNRTKRFACLTPAEALESYVARRQRQASIYEARANTARYLAQRAARLLVAETEPLT